MADLYRVGIDLFLVSERLLRLIVDRDASAVETRKTTFQGKHASAIGPYWLAMPMRVLDAVDITKSSVWLRRPETVVGSGKFVTHVAYQKGYVFRRDISSDVFCFVDEFTGGWFWHRDLIEAAADIGARGLLFGFRQVELAQEIRLRGPNDPSEW
jgi:hypothetical protein